MSIAKDADSQISLGSSFHILGPLIVIDLSRTVVRKCGISKQLGDLRLYGIVEISFTHSKLAQILGKQLLRNL